MRAPFLANVMVIWNTLYVSVAQYSQGYFILFGWKLMAPYKMRIEHKRYLALVVHYDYFCRPPISDAESIYT